MHFHKNGLVISLALLLGSPAGIGFENHPEAEFQRTQTPVSLYTFETLAQGMPNEVTAGNSDFSSLSPIQFDKTTQDFEDFLARRSQSYRQFENLDQVGKLAFEWGNGLGEAGTGPSAAGDPIILFGRLAVSSFMDHFQRVAEDQIKQEDKDALRAFLGSRRIDPKALHDAGAFGGAKYISEFSRETGISPAVFEHLRAELQGEALKREIDLAIAAQGQIAHEVSANEKQDEEKFLSLYKRTRRLERASQHLRDEMVSLSKQTSENAASLESTSEAVRDFLFNNLPTDKQIELLGEPGALGLSSARAAQLKTNIERARDLDNFLQTGQITSDLLIKLGLDRGDFAITLARSFQGISTSYSVTELLSKGGYTNFLTAINLVSGFLGAFQSKSDEHAYEEIMKALAVIAKELEKLDNKLSALYELTQSTGRTLEILSLNNLRLSDNEHFRYQRSCDIFLQGTRTAGDLTQPLLPYEQIVRNYDEENLKPYFQTCIEGLRQEFDGRQSNPFLGFSATNARRRSSEFRGTNLKPVEDLLAPLYNYIHYFVNDTEDPTASPNDSGHVNFIHAVSYLPGGSFLAIERKRQLVSQHDESWLSRIPDRNFYLDGEIADEIIDPQSLERCIQYALAVYAFPEMMDHDGRMLTPVEIRNRNASSSEGVNLLQATLPWLNVAIAQQRLLSGDVLIPYLAADMFKSYDKAAFHWNFIDIPTEQQLRETQSREILRTALAQHILDTYPVIRENTARYVLYRSIANKASVSYAWAYNMDPTKAAQAVDENAAQSCPQGFDGSIAYLNRLTDPRLPAIRSDSGGNHPHWSFCIQFAGESAQPRFIVVPDPAEVDHRAFSGTTGLYHLLALREAVERQLLGCDVVRKAQAENKLRYIGSLVSDYYVH